jgi:hypothetical protein
MDSIYLDNNATTPVLPAVWEALRPFQTAVYGNPFPLRLRTPDTDLSVPRQWVTESVIPDAARMDTSPERQRRDGPVAGAAGLCQISPRRVYRETSS